MAEAVGKSLIKMKDQGMAKMEARRARQEQVKAQKEEAKAKAAEAKAKAAEEKARLIPPYLEIGPNDPKSEEFLKAIKKAYVVRKNQYLTCENPSSPWSKYMGHQYYPWKTNKGLKRELIIR